MLDQFFKHTHPCKSYMDKLAGGLWLVLCALVRSSLVRLLVHMSCLGLLALRAPGCQKLTKQSNGACNKQE